MQFHKTVHFVHNASTAQYIIERQGYHIFHSTIHHRGAWESYLSRGEKK